MVSGYRYLGGVSVGGARVFLWVLGNRLYARAGRRTVFLGNLAADPLGTAVRLARLLGARRDLRRLLRVVAAAIGSALRLVRSRRCRDRLGDRPRLWELEALLWDAASALAAISPIYWRIVERCLGGLCPR